MISKAILVTALAASTSAMLHPHELIARQTNLPSGDCLNAILSLATIAPLPPSDIVSFVETASITDVCAYSTRLPASLTGEWNSYESQVSSWYTAHSVEISSALASCPSDYSTSVGPCSTAINLASSGTGGSVTTTAASGSSGQGSPSKNVGPRETGFVAAAIAAAGFLGGIVAL
jgi:hypothetical protein